MNSDVIDQVREAVALAGGFDVRIHWGRTPVMVWGDARLRLGDDEGRLPWTWTPERGVMWHA